MRADIARLRRDFEYVTRSWLERGVVDPDEVAQMRAWLVEQTSRVRPPTPQIDDRDQAQRITAWARTWRELALDTPAPWHSAGPRGVLMRDMVIEVKPKEQDKWASTW